jgi:RHS repeat-associated protein
MGLFLGATIQQLLVPLPGGAAAEYLSWGLSHYRHADWLGSLRLESSTAHAILDDNAYAPFGEPYSQTGNGEISFTGQNKDTLWLQYDFLARQYDPKQGRWVSPDPVGASLGDPTNPQSLNLYAYVLNNPLSSTDPLGLFCVWDDGSFDSNGDPDTGSQSVCEGVGGTWFNGSPSDWDPNASDWSGQASLEFAGWAQGINPTVGDFGDPSGTPDVEVEASFPFLNTISSALPGQVSPNSPAGNCPVSPLSGNPHISTQFGAVDKSHPDPHTGRDYAVPIGTPVYPPYAGRVGFAGSAGTFGNLVVVTTPAWNVYFGHLSQIQVGYGSNISAGTQVGLSGNTGHSTGPHLHFEMHTAGPIWHGGYAPRATAIEPCK